MKVCYINALRNWNLPKTPDFTITALHPFACTKSQSWWADKGAFLPRVLVLARAREVHLCPLHSSSDGFWQLEHLSLSQLGCPATGRVLQQIQLPRQSWLMPETWQAARAAERPAGFSLHNPLTRNPDVPGHSFLSLGTSHLPAAAWISLRLPSHRNKQPSFFLSL